MRFSVVYKGLSEKVCHSFMTNSGELEEMHGGFLISVRIHEKEHSFCSSATTCNGKGEKKLENCTSCFLFASQFIFQLHFVPFINS